MNRKELSAIFENPPPGFFLRKTRIGNKLTWTMKVSPEEFSKISHLWDNEGRPNSKFVKFAHEGYAWSLHCRIRDLHVHRSLPHLEKTADTFDISVYGTCGDSWFGSVPWFMDNKYGGNLRVAKAVFSEFLSRLEEYRGAVAGEKFGF